MKAGYRHVKVGRSVGWPMVLGPKAKAGCGARTAAVGGDVDAAVDRVQLDRDELAHLQGRGHTTVRMRLGGSHHLDRDELAHVAGAAQLPHRREQPARLAVRAQDEACATWSGGVGR